MCFLQVKRTQITQMDVDFVFGEFIYLELITRFRDSFINMFCFE